MELERLVAALAPEAVLGSRDPVEVRDLAYDAGRVEVRGGSWLNMIGVLRVSGRNALPPNKRLGTIGFRCAQ